MTDATPAAVAIELHPGEPATTAAALHEISRVAAFSEVLKEHDERIRATLRNAATEHKAAGEETRWTTEIKSVAKAYLTEPEPRHNVTDRAAFARWAAEHTPTRTARRLEVDHRKLEELLNAAGGNAALRAFLEELGVDVHEEIYTDEALADEVAEGATLEGVDDPDATEGKIVNPDSGEVIPGLAWARSKPQLTVKVDAAHKRQLAEELRDRLATTALEAGEDHP